MWKWDPFKTDKDIELVSECILKWREIVFFDGVDEGTTNCALCREYHSDWDGERRCCFGCPIYEKTKEDCCGNTPYSKYGNLWWDLGVGLVPVDYKDLRKLEAAANSMLTFLYWLRREVIVQKWNRSEE
jgi:hypothetical protein